MPILASLAAASIWAAALRKLTHLYKEPEVADITQTPVVSDTYYEVCDITGTTLISFIRVYSYDAGSADGYLVIKITTENGIEEYNIICSDSTFYYIYYGADGLTNSTTITMAGKNESREFSQFKCEVKEHVSQSNIDSIDGKVVHSDLS